MVEGAVSVLSRTPSDATAFAMGDLLFTLAVRETDEGGAGGSVVSALMAYIR